MSEPKPTGKRRNEMRWEQGRRIVDIISPTLPTASHVAVLMYCWFRARGRECAFSEARSQIAKATRLSEESVKRLLRDLERGGVIKTTEVSLGRGNVCRRIVTGMPYSVGQIKGVMGDPLKQIKGVMGDRKRGHG